MDEFIVYTVILGRYDRLRSPLMRNDKWHYVCLTDTQIPETPPWEIRLIKREGNNTRRECRKFKVLSHRYFPEAEYTLFHDGNIRLNVDQSLHWLKKHDMALCAHPERDCVYDEAKTCIGMKKDDPRVINAQVARYRIEGYPKHIGLVASGVILRRHTEAIRRFNECWWEEISGGSVRDQLSFNCACWKLGMEYDVIPGNVFRNEQFQYLFPHG